MRGINVRVDLHVHSKYSTRPSQWILQKLGCPESFTEPLKIYERARARSMNMVTITDHNTINGSLEIAHLDNAFVSEEITTYFPEDGCKLHVLAYDITEEHHREFQKIRNNVFDLVVYLREQSIVHVLAHPLFAVNERLSTEHFEKSLLLFNSLELNGTRDEMQNSAIKSIVGSLTPEKIDSLSEKHSIEPYGSTPWIKALTGGSDDHSGINIARVYTEITGVKNHREMLRAVADGKCVVQGTAATPHTMAHNIYGIAYQFYKSHFEIAKMKRSAECFRYIDNVLDPGDKEIPGLLEKLQNFIYRQRSKKYFETSDSVQAALFREANRIVENDEQARKVCAGINNGPEELEGEWFRFVGNATDKVLSELGDKIINSALGANFFDLFHAIGAAGSLYASLAPYFLSYGLFASEREFARECMQVFGLQDPLGTETKMAHFTDTFSDVNGVALTLQHQLEVARKHDKKLTVITCSREGSNDQVVNFTPAGEFELPEYPELSFKYPPFLRVLSHCLENNYTVLHLATPGPVGLAGLAVARLLKLPVHGTYHTAFPQYVKAFTDDTGLEDLAWKFMIWFYNQLDTVFVPSEATGDELIKKGVDLEKVRVYPRGVDITRFTPEKRNGFYNGKFQVKETVKLLYVGRVSREKNLDVLTEAFKTVSSIRSELHLVVVGDGPYLKEMKQKLAGLPATFTGYLGGEDLAQCYASSDVFVFPSATDTFGNVVLEAQASGLPVIVTDFGGPCENLIEDKTGLIVEAGNTDAMVRAILRLSDHPELLQYMKRSARTYTEKRSFDAEFLKTWTLYEDLSRRSSMQ
ncbi:glycosyltransferase [Maridesulfovibrio hydrothermalis]|uniref:Glycosyl transferase group 1 n=1 Tax=Maridesulfovibrio hydrothermalis AM13 = DSM 14728 TaxID=1121451 RepID=L0R8C3_9BACT|nr:glycosyltransferase [Maridesulfovibrio hydrothermalis]CCO22425.1 Glycosyl transferase group 1 [Maridesulfovibrio hydrothermalis AM13 = DSM 14728]